MAPKAIDLIDDAIRTCSKLDELVNIQESNLYYKNNIFFSIL